MSTERRLTRAAFQWGGLALAILWWVCLGFVAELRRYIDKVARDFNLDLLPDRVSQLRPTALKVPFTYVYLAIFLAVALAVLGVLFVGGLREAMKPETPDE